MGRIAAVLLTVLILSGCQKAAEKPAVTTVLKPAQNEAAERDEFGLPIIIHMDVPEAPPEVQKPSPPIPKEPQSP